MGVRVGSASHLQPNTSPQDRLLVPASHDEFPRGYVESVVTTNPPKIQVRQPVKLARGREFNTYSEPGLIKP